MVAVCGVWKRRSESRNFGSGWLFPWPRTTCIGVVLGQLCPLPVSGGCSSILLLPYFWLWDHFPLLCSLEPPKYGAERLILEAFQVPENCAVCGHLDPQCQACSGFYAGTAVMSGLPKSSLCSLGKSVLCLHLLAFYSMCICWMPGTGKALCFKCGLSSFPSSFKSLCRQHLLHECFPSSSRKIRAPGSGLVLCTQVHVGVYYKLQFSCLSHLYMTFLRTGACLSHFYLI